MDILLFFLIGDYGVTLSFDLVPWLTAYYIKGKNFILWYEDLQTTHSIIFKIGSASSRITTQDILEALLGVATFF